MVNGQNWMKLNSHASKTQSELFDDRIDRWQWKWLYFSGTLSHIAKTPVNDRMVWFVVSFTECEFRRWYRSAYKCQCHEYLYTSVPLNRPNLRAILLLAGAFSAIVVVVVLPVFGCHVCPNWPTKTKNCHDFFIHFSVCYHPSHSVPVILSYFSYFRSYACFTIWKPCCSRSFVLHCNSSFC